MSDLIVSKLVPSRKYRTKKSFNCEIVIIAKIKTIRETKMYFNKRGLRTTRKKKRLTATERMQDLEFVKRSPARVKTNIVLNKIFLLGLLFSGRKKRGTENGIDTASNKPTAFG